MAPYLESDLNNQLSIDYLRNLSEEELITDYAFVIMPNHIHLIWQQNKLNGKETPKGRGFVCHEPGQGTILSEYFI